MHDLARDEDVFPDVAGEHGDALSFEEGFYLEIRGSHGNPHRLHLVGAGYDAAVVGGEDHDGAFFEGGMEAPLAGHEKIVAVAQRHDPPGRSARIADTAIRNHDKNPQRIYFTTTNRGYMDILLLSISAYLCSDNAKRAPETPFVSRRGRIFEKYQKR